MSVSVRALITGVAAASVMFSPLTAADAVTAPVKDSYSIEGYLPIWDPCSTITYGFQGPKKVIRKSTAPTRRALNRISRLTGMKFKRVPFEQAQVSMKVRSGGWRGVAGPERSMTYWVPSPSWWTFQRGGMTLWMSAGLSDGQRQVLITHEWMHVLGIGHAKSKSSIMYPTFQFNEVRLSGWDRRALSKASSKRMGCLSAPQPLGSVSAQVTWEVGNYGQGTQVYPTLRFGWDNPQDSSITHVGLRFGSEEENTTHSVRTSVPSTSAGAESYWCGPDGVVTVKVQTRNRFNVTETEQTVTCQGNGIPAGMELAQYSQAV